MQDGLVEGSARAHAPAAGHALSVGGCERVNVGPGHVGLAALSRAGLRRPRDDPRRPLAPSVDPG